MKIIKSGKDKVFVTRCSSCATDLEYTLDDVTINGTPIDGRNVYTNTIKCPVCGCEIMAYMQTQEDMDRQRNMVLCPPYACNI